MSRWIRVQTAIFDHEIFAAEPFSEREAWLWLIARAAWKATVHRVGAAVLPVPPGCLFVTIRQMQLAWKWTSTRRVHQFLQLLASQNMIETSAETGKTRISICNYSRYQQGEMPVETAQHSFAAQARNTKDTTPPDTRNSSLRSQPPQPHPAEPKPSPSASRPSPRKRACRMPVDFTPDLDFAVSLGLSFSQAKAEVEAMRDWSASSPKGAKLDWPATWRGWVRRAVGPQMPRPSGQPPPGFGADARGYRPDPNGRGPDPGGLWPGQSQTRPKTRESEFARHQRQCTEQLERTVYGRPRDDDRNSDQNGHRDKHPGNLDLEPGDWRAAGPAGPGR
jgi:hypothetical protein